MYWGFARIVPWVTMPYLRQNRWVQSFTSWIAASWWGFPLPLSTNGGSGDKPFDWALACAVLMVSAGGTLLWSAIDWKRQGYPGIHKWFRVLLRFGLGYHDGRLRDGEGLSRCRCRYPGLTRLLEPYGNVLADGRAVGEDRRFAELRDVHRMRRAGDGGILLFIPGLTTIGALVALA